MVSRVMNARMTNNRVKVSSRVHDDCDSDAVCRILLVSFSLSLHSVSLRLSHSLFSFVSFRSSFMRYSRSRFSREATHSFDVTLHFRLSTCFAFPYPPIVMSIRWDVVIASRTELLKLAASRMRNTW